MSFASSVMSMERPVIGTLSDFHIHRYPYIRLLVPWVAGVLCGSRFFGCSWEFFGCLSDFFRGIEGWGVFIAIFFFSFYFLKRYSLRWCFGVATCVLFFAGGWLGITRQLQGGVYAFPEEEVVYRVKITDTPKAGERTLFCQVRIKEWRDSTGNFHPAGCGAILYLQRDSAAEKVGSGDELLASVRISSPVNGKNWDEFDYVRFLMYRGISGTGYVSSGKWMRLGGDVPFPAFECTALRSMAGKYREKLIAFYRKLGFEGDRLAVLSALTIGDRTDLSESVYESYSVAGTSHVLALSGLHTGLLYALFFFLFKSVTGRRGIGRKVNAVFLFVLLWGFAFFTGFSPSVVRSVTMLSVLVAADVFGRQTLSLNTLAIAAWMLLLVSPAWLFDIGYQLSFFAVASVLLIHRPLYRMLPVKGWVGKYVWGLMSVSVAAQLGTAPLVMFYFSRFPVYFLLANLVVIPLVTIILYAAVLMLFLTFLPWAQVWVTEGVKCLLDGLNVFVRWVERLPYASIDGIWLYGVEVLGIYVSLFLFFRYWTDHRSGSLRLCLFSLVLLGAYHATASWTDRPRNSLVFYNVRGCPAVHCISADRQSWISYGDSFPDKRRLQRVAAGFWRRSRLLPPVEVAAGTRNAGSCCRQQVLSFYGCRICMVTDNRWRNQSVGVPLGIDYLYLCKGYSGHLEELTRLFTPSCVVLDASLPEYRKLLFKDECRQAGLRFISLSEEGSVRFLL